MKLVELIITTYEYKNPGERYSKTGITLNLDGKELPRKLEFNNPHLISEAVAFIDQRGYESIDFNTLFWVLAEEYEELSDYEHQDWYFENNQLVVQLKLSKEGRRRFRVYRLEEGLEETKKELEMIKKELERMKKAEGYDQEIW